jgi:DNA-binding beta-propeller fold protein YncE
LRPFATTAVEGASGRLFKGVFAFAAALLLVFLAISSARAQPAHPSFSPTGTFGTEGSGAPGELASPSGIAVDGTTGDIFVADRVQNRVVIFEPSGNSATYAGEIGAGILQAPYDVAVDESDGSVYVSDAGNNRVVRFLSSGGPTPTYTVDPGYVSPQSGTGPGQVGSFAASIAIDQSSHDLVIADQANRRVDRFNTTTGGFLGSFDGTAEGGPQFATPADIAIATNGDIYVDDVTGDLFNNGSAALRRFTASGLPLGTQQNLPTPSAVAIDSSTGMVIAAGNNRFGQSPELFGFLEGAAAGAVTIPETVSVSDLAVDPRSPQRVYAVTGKQDGSFGPVGVQVFDSAVAAGVSVSPPAAIKTTEIDLRGTVDPGGIAATPHFEYSTDGINWTALPALPNLTGTGEQIVEDTLSGLAINSRYFIRLVATNSSATSTSSPQEVKTLSTAPEVITGSPTDVTMSSAQANGRVNPLGLQTVYHFEYGKTTEYGLRTPSYDEVAGIGRVPRAVAKEISGLEAGTTYHYRLVASNATGTSFGADATFVTASSEGLGRSFEQVTPVDKGTGVTLDRNGLFQAGPGGSGLVYSASAAIESPDTESAPVQSRFLSTRTGEGWQLKPLDPPQLGGKTQSVYLNGTIAVSEDMSHALVVSAKKLTAAAVEGEGNLYLRDTETGSYRLIVTGPRSFYDGTSGLGEKIYFGGSPDFSTVYFSSTYQFTPDAPVGGVKLYRWSGGNLSLSSRSADGSPAASIYIDNIGPVVRRYVSKDGRRAYYATAGSLEEGVYLAETGKPPVPISVSQRPGDPDTVQPGMVLNVSGNGRYAFFLDFGAALTEEGTGSGSDIYRYDADTGALTFVAADGFGIDYAASEDGSAILFSEGFGGPTKLWRNGSVQSLPGSTLLNVTDAIEISSNGRYVAITSYAPLTSDENLNPQACPDDPAGFYGGRCWEIYRYDADTTETVCVSCAKDGSRPAGPVNLINTTFELSAYEPHFVTNSGAVYFDTPTRLVGTDTNGARDVYEYSDGAAHLVSPGDQPVAAEFVDIAREGEDVFFTTAQRLVPADVDDQVDQYDARVGGGIASQQALKASPPECSGEVCQGAPRGAPGSPPMGSGNSEPKKRSAGSLVVKPPQRPVTGRTAKIVVEVPGSGKISASGPSVRAVSRSAAGPGHYSMSVSLTGQAEQRLTRDGQLKTKVTISYTSRAHEMRTRTVTVRFETATAQHGKQGR